MDGMNKVILLGNVGAVDLRFTNAGQAILHMRLATTESWFDKAANERKERTDWHSISVWGKRAEGLAKMITKGSRIMVEGRMQTSDFEDREGNKKQRTEVVASNVLFCGDKRDGATVRPATAQKSFDAAPKGTDDIPF